MCTLENIYFSLLKCTYILFQYYVQLQVLKYLHTGNLYLNIVSENIKQDESSVSSTCILQTPFFTILIFYIPTYPIVHHFNSTSTCHVQVKICKQIKDYRRILQQK